MHGAAGRVGTAALELGAVAGLRMFGTCSARDREAVERLGAVAIDYRNEDFLARVRELTGGQGVDVVLDGIGGKVALRSFRAMRKGDQITGDPGGRLVTMGAYNTLVHGRKSLRAWFEWWPATAITWLWGTLSSRRHVSGYRVQKLRIPHQDWFQEDFLALLELLREGEQSIRSWPSQCRCPTLAALMRCSRARRRRASSCSCPKASRPVLASPSRNLQPSASRRVDSGDPTRIGQTASLVRDFATAFRRLVCIGGHGLGLAVGPTSRVAPGEG